MESETNQLPRAAPHWLKNILRREALADCSREEAEWEQRANALECAPLVQSGAPRSEGWGDAAQQNRRF